MPRKSRIDVPGVHYVRNAGRKGIAPFFYEVNREKFLQVVCESCRRYGVVLHGYLILPDSYHLIVETEKPNLSLFMRQVSAKYSRYRNGEENMRGSLWKDRFASSLLKGKKEILLMYRFWLDQSQSKYPNISPKKYDFFSITTQKGNEMLLECLQNRLKEKHVEKILKGNFSHEEMSEAKAVLRRHQPIPKAENFGDPDLPIEEAIAPSKNIKKRNKRIKKAFEQGYPQTAIARVMGVSQSLVSKVVNASE